MVYFSVTFLCTAGLFLALLEDRYRLWTTVAATVVVYGLALGLAYPIRQLITDPVWGDQVACGAGALLFFVTSLFLYTDNILQKLFVALLSLCDFAFLSFFVPLFLGVLPFPVAGGLAGALSIAAALLFTLLLGLCLYRPLHHYSDRGVSGFLVGMCLLLCFVYLLCLGQFDFLFRARVLAGRLLLAALLYGAMIFAFRSLYQAGRFRARTAAGAAQERILAMESGDVADMLAALREVRSVQKSGEYALDTVTVMLADGLEAQVPGYIAAAQEQRRQNPILAQYHENPYLNAVIATKAAFAAQNQIDFQCSAATGNAPLKTAELCVIVNELLTRACQEAAAYQGPRRLRFTLIPGEDILRFEVFYSGEAPQEKPSFRLKGARFSDLLAWLFDDTPRGDDTLRGLENTAELVERHSGRLSVSGTPGEVLLQAALRF